MSEYRGSILKKKSTVVNIENLPQGFEARSVDFGTYKKIILFCTKKLPSGYNCDFCIRKADATKKPEKLDHECKYINRLNNYSTDLQISGMLLDSIYEFIGKRNISFSAISTEEFTAIIHNAIICGQKNPNDDYMTLFKKFSVSTLSRRWNVFMANKQASELLNFANNFGNCLCIDAGKHKSRPYLIVAISNALQKTSPKIIKSIRFFNGAALDYKEEIYWLVNNLFMRNIKITNIISDNCRSQVCAIDHNSKNSFQNDPRAPDFMHRIIWISCGCHNLALAINDLSKKGSLHYSILFEKFSNIVALLRTKAMINLLNLICPPMSPTRWTGLFDIAFWILKHMNHIKITLEQMLKQPEAYEIPDNLIDLLFQVPFKFFVLFLPYKIASEKLESERMPAAYTLPIIQSAIEMAKSNNHLLNNEDDNSLVDELISSVYNRFFSTKSGELLNFLYYVTPEGRAYHRATYPQVCEGKDTVIPEFNFSITIPDNYNKIIQQYIENVDIFTEIVTKITSLFHNYKGKLFRISDRKKVSQHATDSIDEFIPEKNQEDEHSNRFITIDKEPEVSYPYYTEKDVPLENAEDENQISNETVEKEKDDDDDDFEIEDADTFTSPVEDDGYITAMKTLGELLDRNYPNNQKKKEELFDFYVNWINGDPNDYVVNQNLLTQGLKYWINVATSSISGEFASFILPYLSAATSEGICERAFWYQRRSIGDQGMRTSPQTELNRINCQIDRNLK